MQFFTTFVTTLQGIYRRGKFITGYEVNVVTYESYTQFLKIEILKPGW